MYLMHIQCIYNPRNAILETVPQKIPELLRKFHLKGQGGILGSKYVNRMPRGSLLSTFSSLSNLQLSLSSLYHAQLSLTIGARVRSSKRLSCEGLSCERLSCE
jgi:hypothetical protein